ncbi:hypothetical protein F7308_0013 [Francisella salina]|uniref:Uncharacterized protein n=1 Tax=Francisella salina TaxID=573569 RepID=A0ABM5M6X5_FRAST|nr:hypothetical protein [Francisella salina]AEI34941.1 hypothetical protein F7308_0013 [Francisella salina]
MIFWPKPFIFVTLLGTICGSKSLSLSLGTNISILPVSVDRLLLLYPFQTFD